MVTQHLAPTGGGSCTDVLSCVTVDAVSLALGSAVFLLFFFAAVSNVRLARTTVREERDRISAEADAFAAFGRRVADLDAAPTFTGGATPGATALVEGGSAPRLKQVRDAYRQTVMSVPHYTEEYDEPLATNMAVEFGDDVAGAVATGTTLPPPLKETLVGRSEQARRQRRVLMQHLDEEADSLADAEPTLEQAARTVDRLENEPLYTADYDDLRAEWYVLEDREHACEQLVDTRQQQIDDHRELATRVDEIDSIEEYLYEPLDVTYPVLADAATILADISELKHRIAASISMRA